MKKNVVVLFGGISSEHAVSCLSAAGVIRNIDYSKFSIIPVGITKDGSWLKTMVLFLLNRIISPLVISPCLI